MARSPDKTYDQPASDKPVADGRHQPQLNAKTAALSPGPDAKDRPGFDLGGAVTDATAGSGLGLGEDAAENRKDRQLPGRRPENKPGLPRFGGAGVKDK